MQLLGVKYYMAFSPAAVKEARQQKNLTEIATSGPWVIFEVADSDIVTPLTNEPVVVKGADKDAKSWLHMSEDFFLDPSQWNVELAASGPKDWAADRDRPDPSADRRRPPCAVSNITTDDDRISFDVDKVGVPVLVKASYFPNWQASGAEGPWRVAPNLMVVIPTSTHVSLHYGRTPVDLIAIVPHVARHRRRRVARSQPAARRSRRRSRSPEEPARPARALGRSSGTPGRSGTAPMDGSPTRRPRRSGATSRNRQPGPRSLRSGETRPGRRRDGAVARRACAILVTGDDARRSTRSSRPTTSGARCPTSSTPTIVRAIGTAFARFAAAPRVLDRARHARVGPRARGRVLRGCASRGRRRQSSSGSRRPT